MIYNRLILVKKKDNGKKNNNESDNSWMNNNGKRDTKMVKKVKVNIIAHKNMNKIRIFIFISFYFNIAFLIKIYNTKSIIN